MKVFVNNQNFIESVKALKSCGFDNDIEYIFYYDNLNKDYRKYLLGNDLPRSKISFQVTKNKNDKEIKELYKKYKHQINFIGEELTVDVVLDKIFAGNEDKTKLLDELSDFDNKYIMEWLKSTSANVKKLSEKLSKIDKFIYSKYFKYFIVYELYGLKCKSMYPKKKEG